MSFKQIKRQRAKKAVTPSLLPSLTPYQILWNPIVTEKAYAMIESLNTYAFKVPMLATKADVKASLSYVYDVVPSSVRVVSVPRKWRMQRKLVRRAYKKVYVTLPEWKSIDLAA
jgi:ribosomal protein L23